LRANNLGATVTMAGTYEKTCQVGAPEAGAEMRAWPPELQRQVPMPPWPEAPQWPGIPGGQQEWPDPMPVPDG
jgi:hypothetical protein